MQLLFRRRVVVSVCLLALAILTAIPASAAGLPERPGPGKKGFRLFARASGLLSVNQVVCGLVSDGQICVDTLQSSTVPGWILAQGHQQPVHLQLGYLDRRAHRTGAAGLGGRHHGGILL